VVDRFSTYYLDKWTELTHFGLKTLGQLELEIEGIVEEVSRLEVFLGHLKMCSQLKMPSSRSASPMENLGCKVEISCW
jgi:hypothetical protein